jgi:hypothetical protein
MKEMFLFFKHFNSLYALPCFILAKLKRLPQTGPPELPYAGWFRKLLNNRDILLLNRLEVPIAISSLIEFADEFSLKLYCQKIICQDMEGVMERQRRKLKFRYRQPVKEVPPKVPCLTFSSPVLVGGCGE